MNTPNTTLAGLPHDEFYRQLRDQHAKAERWDAANLSDHERLNCVWFTPEQRRRVESERQVDGVAERTRSGFELAAYRMPNGSRFVTLVDGGEETWEAYAEELRAEVKRICG